MKNFAASFLRAIGFLGLFGGGYLAFVLTFSGGFNESKMMWVIFVSGILCVFIGDSLKKSEGAEILPQSGELASITSRFKAAMIDSLPYVIYLLLQKRHDFTSGVELLFIGAIGAFTIWQIINLTYSGQTIGKKLLKIRIVTVATGENGGFMINVVRRSILNSILNVIPLYGIADVLFIFRLDRRCVHDFLAGTRVVNV